MSGYDDILPLPHHRSTVRKPMPLADRAAQFAPFAALTGFEEELDETARRTEEKIELGEDARTVLNERLRLLEQRRGEPPEVALVCFMPDARKDGGAYVTMMGRVKRVDALEQTITLSDGRRIPMDDILALEGRVFEEGGKIARCPTDFG